MGKRNNKFLNKIYSQPLPITLTSQKYNVSLPELYPHNPVSWVWYLLRYFQINIFYPVPELTKQPLPIIYDVDGQIFKVTDDASIKLLWRFGFFGKGILSRSEPTWYKRTLTRLNLTVDGKNDKADGGNGGNEGLAMEDITKIRRDERKFFKLERSRFQQLELKKRQGVITEEELKEMEILDTKLVELRKADIKFDEKGEEQLNELRDEDEDIIDEDGKLIPLEFLQLQPVETFFLKFALNMIQIDNINTTMDLFRECCSHYQSSSGTSIITPNNRFIVDYAVYHYFRSNGWCVRSGVKFGTDFLLYRRGPPFIHAEYCILVMTKDSKYNWFEIAAKARVVGSVKKTFVLCYVEYPNQEDFDRVLDQNDLDQGLVVKELLEQYKISEVVYKRWNPSRSRD